MTDSYLIWSHEHSGWWRPGGLGYSSNIDSAGRFTRNHALDICRRALPGQYKPGWPLPELPIAEADLMAVLRPEKKRAAGARQELN
jgi:hypothetical protein